MSDTPESDAAAFVYREANSEHGLVTSDFARTLERRAVIAERKLKAAEAGLKAVDELISNSHGVRLAAPTQRISA